MVALSPCLRLAACAPSTSTMSEWGWATVRCTGSQILDEPRGRVENAFRAVAFTAISRHPAAACQAQSPARVECWKSRGCDMLDDPSAEAVALRNRPEKKDHVAVPECHLLVEAMRDVVAILPSTPTSRSATTVLSSNPRSRRSVGRRNGCQSSHQSALPAPARTHQAHPNPTRALINPSRWLMGQDRCSFRFTSGSASPGNSRWAAGQP